MQNIDLDNVEIIGERLLMYLNHMEAEETLPVLRKYHIEENVDPNRWYPAKPILDFLWEVATGPNAMYNLVSIGIEAARMLQFPPELEGISLEAFLTNILPPTYVSFFRGGYVGYLKCERVTEHHIKMICVTPLPDDGWYGTVFGLAQRLLPHGTRFTVEYDNQAARHDFGGDETIIHVKWE